jgi:hypothetical protein
MVMDRIGGFSNVSKAFLDKFQGSDRTDATGKKRASVNDLHVAADGADQRSIPLDKAEISQKAHQLNALRMAVESGREALDQVPDVRQDRVAEVRARLNRGYYNSVEVRAQVAAKLNAVARTLEDL